MYEDNLFFLPCASQRKPFFS